METREPEVIRDKEAMRRWSRSMRSQGKTIGLVPTMGFLHDGHLSLVRQSLTLSDVTVVSIYVNPGQFSPTEDLSTYPSDFSGDLAKLAAVSSSGSVIVVFNPKNLYDYDGVRNEKTNSGGGSGGGKVVSCVEEGGLGHETWVRVERLEKGLCGKSRPVFFRGVATIVTKLFNIVEPDVAMFGKKDYQQWRLIKRMVRDLDFGIEIVGSDIAREKDGLAMSSRNVHLSAEDRQRALSISRSLAMAKASADQGKIGCEELKDMIISEIVGAAGRIDYVEHVFVVSSKVLPMVGHAVSPSLCIHLQMPTVHFSKISCLSKNPCAQRKPFGSCSITCRPSGEARRRYVSTSLNLGDYLSRGESSCKCTCLASLAEFDAVAGSGWVPIGDQVLLMASVFLTYMAGVIPLQNSSYSSTKNTVEENPDVGTSESSGRDTDFEGDLKSVWDVVKGKLLDSLDAIKRESTLGRRVLKAKLPQGKPPLNLYAVSEGPQMYLLWSCFQKLEEETNKISNTTSSDEWMVSFTDIVCQAYQGACTAWLKRELSVGNTEAITPLLIKMLNEKDAIFDKIRKSGKEELFVDFLYFHRFGSSRKASCYDLSLFRTHGVAILEDLMITLADGVASIYLEFISVDSKFSDEMNTGGLDICILSSRALQKLLALYQWLHQNMEAVVSMYEDRFDLYILQTQVINNPDGGDDVKGGNWWRKLTPGKAKAASSSAPLRYSVISDFSLPVKRTKELKALSGWRYYFSLFLELSDIGMPIIRVVLDKVSSVISFFLVTLIGRSVGLIFTGIRQSLRWK
ncbi:unnamed protein product [Brassica rapa subsp. narinosa]